MERQRQTVEEDIGIEGKHAFPADDDDGQESGERKSRTMDRWMDDGGQNAYYSISP